MIHIDIDNIGKDNNNTNHDNCNAALNNNKESNVPIRPTQKTSVRTSIVRKLSTFSLSRKSSPCVQIPTDCKFKIIVRTTKPELTVSFMLPDIPGYALTTNKSDDMLAEKVVNDYKFWERSSFHPCINMWYNGFCAFESIREASRFVLYTDGRFHFRKYDGTDNFKKDASFVFRKKVPTYIPRRSLSTVVPPEMNKLKVPSKSRKLSLMSIRNTRHHHDTTSQELQAIMSNSINENDHFNTATTKQSQKKAFYSLGFNERAGCLHLSVYTKPTSSNTDDVE